MKNRIILLNTETSNFAPIWDRIEYEKISDDVVSANNSCDAQALIPTGKPCVIITDSIVANQRKNDNITDGINSLVKWIKMEKTNCKIILYSASFFDLDVSQFDF